MPKNRTPQTAQEREAWRMAKSLGQIIEDICQKQEEIESSITSEVAYVAGPYSAKTIFGKLRNIYRAWKVAYTLWQQGYTVICPHSNSMLMENAIGNEEFAKRDLHIVERCDIIFMLPGWTRSNGAIKEYHHALKHGLEIRELSDE